MQLMKYPTNLFNILETQEINFLKKIEYNFTYDVGCSFLKKLEEL